MATQPEWEAFVLSTYEENVTQEEFQNKAATNPIATRKIAYYYKGSGYDLDYDKMSDFASDFMLLYDFLNFTDGV